MVVSELLSHVAAFPWCTQCLLHHSACTTVAIVYLHDFPVPAAEHAAAAAAAAMSTADSHLVDGALDLTSIYVLQYLCMNRIATDTLTLATIGPSDAAYYSWFHVHVPALWDALSSYMGAAGVTAIDLACALPISLWRHFAAKTLTQFHM